MKSEYLDILIDCETLRYDLTSRFGKSKKDSKQVDPVKPNEKSEINILGLGGPHEKGTLDLDQIP